MCLADRYSIVYRRARRLRARDSRRRGECMPKPLLSVRLRTGRRLRHLLRMPPRAAAKKKMPSFTKPTEATLTAFTRAIETLGDVERRTMFGYPAAFISGNMLASVFQDRIMIRLSEADRLAA